MKDDSIRIGMVLTPPSEHHFRLASQVGVTDFVARYGTVNTREKLRQVYDQASSFGLRLSVVEGYLPLDAVVRGESGRDAQIEEIKQLIINMGELGIPLVCYNFMQSDWTRTSFEKVVRGGALSTGFDLAALEQQQRPPEHCLSAEQLWDNLHYFLQRVLPVAESAGVTLAMHPDDPPLPTLLGSAQIMYNAACFDRLFELSSSPANAMCFCQGTFAEMGVNIPKTIRHFGDRIKYIHFRDVRGTATNFVETFHDDGQTNMAAAMLTYKQIGFSGPMRPDHVPKLDGEPGPADGYTMHGRLFAAGYMRGLLHAAQEFGPIEAHSNAFSEPQVLNGRSA